MVAWTIAAAAFLALACTSCAGWKTGDIEITTPLGVGIKWKLPERPATNTTSGTTTATAAPVNPAP